MRRLRAWWRRLWSCPVCNGTGHGDSVYTGGERGGVTEDATVVIGVTYACPMCRHSRRAGRLSLWQLLHGTGRRWRRAR